MIISKLAYVAVCQLENTFIKTRLLQNVLLNRQKQIGRVMVFVRKNDMKGFKPVAGLCLWNLSSSKAYEVTTERPLK